jgi:hypothetical protein
MEGVASAISGYMPIHLRLCLIIPGKPPAMLGRLPEFDNSGRKRKPPISEPRKAHVKEAFDEEQQ